MKDKFAWTRLYAKSVSHLARELTSDPERFLDKESVYGFAAMAYALSIRVPDLCDTLDSATPSPKEAKPLNPEKPIGATYNPDTNTVTVDLENYTELLNADTFLDCLRNEGVDNWVGYEHAQEDYCEKEPEEVAKALLQREVTG